MKRYVIPTILIFLVLIFAPVAFAAVDASGGIPPVTTEQAANKINRIGQEVYSLAQGTIGWYTLLLLMGCIFLSIIFKAARIAIFFVILGFFFVMFAPQIIGWMTHLTKV